MGHGDVFTVGYDGSPGARRALEWAAAEAARRHGSVRVVACVIAPVAAEPWYVPPAVIDIHQVQEDTLRHLQEAVVPFRAQHPGVRFDLEARLGPAPGELVDAAGEDGVLVVGSRGHERFDALRLGSVAHAVARRARCPVVIVPDVDVAQLHGRVVVGVDGSADADEALRLACREAELRDAELLLVHAWDYPYATELGTSEACDRAQVDGALVLEEAVRRARDLWAGPIKDKLVRGRAASALLEEAGTADLLVVGSRGRGAVRSFLFGSVSTEVSDRAPCPVMVVRAEAADADR
jgi:nucleotide-binding universal stress UspA family protein